MTKAMMTFLQKTVEHDGNCSDVYYNYGRRAGVSCSDDESCPIKQELLKDNKVCHTHNILQAAQKLLRSSDIGNIESIW